MKRLSYWVIMCENKCVLAILEKGYGTDNTPKSVNIFS